MPEFNVNRPIWVTPEHAKAKINDAWIGQYAGSGYISSLIMRGTQSVHSHSAMFARSENGEVKVDVMELREFRGGRNKPIEYHLRNAHRLDVFSPNWNNRWPEFNPTGAVDAMRHLTEYDYGYRGLMRMLLRRTPVAWRFYPPTTDDRLPEDGKPIRQPFCSHAVSLATHLGGNVDPVPRSPHWEVSPGDLTTSMFYDYQFTILTDWSLRKYGVEILMEAENNVRLLDTGDPEQIARCGCGDDLD